MLRNRVVRRRIAALLVFAQVAIVSAAAASMRWHLVCRSPTIPGSRGRLACDIAHAGVSVSWFSRYAFEEALVRIDSPLKSDRLCLWFDMQADSSGWHIEIPMWTIAMVTFIAILAMYWNYDDRGLSHGVCQKCGYCMTSQTCPECGTATESAKQHS